MPTNPPSPMPTQAPSPYQIEIIVRTAENFHSREDISAFVAMAARHQVKVISVLVKQDEDGFISSGQVFYRSKIAPIAPGYMRLDVLQVMLEEAHARGIQVRAWMPQFHDQVAARQHPGWQMMALRDGQVRAFSGSGNEEYFVNPLNPKVQQYELGLIREVVENYAVDGIMLDWLRFDDFNMDMGESTRAAFKAKTGIDPLEIDLASENPARAAWNEFRTDGIGAYARAVRASLPKGMLLGVYILPPEFIECGQDAAKFNNQVDFISPMCYNRDWGFPLDWIWGSCLQTTRQKAGSAAVLPTLEIGTRTTLSASGTSVPNLGDEHFHQILTHLRYDYPQITRLSWFFHESWTEELLQRIEIISSW